MSDQISIYERLRDVQVELHAPKDEDGRFGKSRSAEKILEVAKPLCAKHGLTLVLSDELVLIGERHYVKATASIYDGPDGPGEHKISGQAYAWEGEIDRGLDASQVTGKASSYARKYALSGLFAIDDTKDADRDMESAKPASRPAVGSKPKPGVELATDGQRAQIRAFSKALGVEGDEDIAEFLKTDYGVTGKLTKAEAARVLKEMQ